MRKAPLKTLFWTWPGLSVYATPPQMLFGEFAPPAPSTHVLPSSECLCVYYWQEAVTGKAPQPAGKRRLNMVWWGMWENSRVHLYIQQPACQPSSGPSRPLSAWTRGAFVPHLLATPCPAPAPPSYPSLHPVAPPLPPSFHSPQNSTAGPLWK